ncbi:MAG: hypothetical protein RDV48_12010 [Candidatus Eremiobacteraeota bacterium]|nr:hypothetical protein [Candidatus Eremiobacteraeota bacterium]
MMCVKCGITYDDPCIKFCIRCRIPLPRFSADTAGRPATSLFDVTDGGGGRRLHYPSPARAYDTDLIRPLLEAAWQFTKGEAAQDAVVSAFMGTRDRFSLFREKELPAIQDRFEVALRENKAVECCRQMLYLLGKGAMLFEEGLCDVEGFLGCGEGEALLRGVLKMQEGNDYIGLAGEVIESNIEEIEGVLSALPMSHKAIEA